jgi:hypothetical protein
LSALVQVVELIRPHVSDRKIASRRATRFFLVWFPIVSAVLYGGGTLLMNAVSTESFRTAAYFGLGLCTVSSIISFFITEWAVDLPNNVFFGVAFGSVFVRIFTLLFAFAIAQFVFKMNPMGMVSGMFSAYFSYLAIEITYIHKKSLNNGH